ncbi:MULTISPECIES: CHAT domain-containing protein, partial [Cyanophyceae]|uniref:CHAT domain-containing protein n=1 Tax=Cyanophyceae TaxID=3028117 RepID=UPI0016841B96
LPNEQILSINAPLAGFPINQQDDLVSFIDGLLEAESENYLGENFTDKAVTTQNLQETLKIIESQTGEKAAVVYMRLCTGEECKATTNKLQLVLATPDDEPIATTPPIDPKEKKLCSEVDNFLEAMNSPLNKRYLPIAKKLYRQLIAPIEPKLKASNIKTLIFARNDCLRRIPLAALHDGQQFLVEKYSIGSIPSVSLTDTSFYTLKKSLVLGMGASVFPNSNHQPLPAVPVELSTITQHLWRGESFLNEQFTLDNLRSQRQQKQFNIVHLATHAFFQPNASKSPYIQLWDTKMGLDELRQLQWYAPPMVELLVLSACQTALGDENTDMGFAALAVQAGVKSVLASLWLVDDAGTLALMSGFYYQLSQEEVTIKAEALRQAQLAMLRGEVRIESGQLIGVGTKVSLPPEVKNRTERVLSHPYYWAGFTMIGSPW